MEQYSLTRLISNSNQTIVELLPEDTLITHNILKKETDTGNNVIVDNPLENTDYNLLLIKTWQSANIIKEKFFPNYDVILTPFLNCRCQKRQLILCFGNKAILSSFQEKVEKITWIESATQFSWEKIIYPQANEEKDLFLILNSEVEDKDLLLLTSKIEEILEKFVKIGLIPAFSWKIRMKETSLETTEQKKECFFYLKFPELSTSIIAIIKIFLHNQQIMLNRKFMHLKCFWLKTRNKN
jgi:hypothetical protein